MLNLIMGNPTQIKSHSTKYVTITHKVQGHERQRKLKNFVGSGDPTAKCEVRF